MHRNISVEWQICESEILHFLLQIVIFRKCGLSRVPCCLVSQGHGSLTHIQRRCLTKKPNFSGNKLVANFEKDKVPEGYKFVYCKGNITYFTLGIPAFFFASIFTAAVVVYVYVVTQVQTNKPVRIDDPYSQSDSLSLFILFAAAFLPGLTLLFIILTKNVMLRMYFNESTDKYYAVLLRYGLFRKILNFTSKDVEIRSQPKNLWNVCICGYRMLVQEADFTNIKYFNRFMQGDLNSESVYLKRLEMENMPTNIEKSTEKILAPETDKQYVRRYIQKRKVLNIEKLKETEKEKVT